MRKYTYLLMAGAILVSLLAACAKPTEAPTEAPQPTTPPPTEEPAAPAGDGVVEFWTSETQEDRMAVQEALAAEFMAANPDIEVQVVAVDENDIPEKVAAAKAAGTLPDVMHLSIDYVVGYATEGLLDEVANSEVIQELGEDGFFAGTLEFGKSPTGAAKYAAVPIDSWVQGIWYRKDLFDEAGLNPPQTWDDIMAAAKHFNKPAEGFYGIILSTFPNEVFTQQVFEEFALANGARPFDADGNIVLDSDRFAEAMDYYAELSQYGPPGKTTWRDCRQYYIAGQAAMMFYSTYIMDDLAGLVADLQVEVEDLTGKTGMESLMIGAHGDEASYGQVNYVAVTKGGDTDASKEWIKFLLSDENYIKWVFMTPAGKTPVRKSAVEEWSQAELFGYYDPAIAETIAGGLDAVKRWGYQGGKSFPLLSDIYGSLIVPQAVVSVIEGTMTSAEAAAWAQGQLESLAAAKPVVPLPEMEGAIEFWTSETQEDRIAVQEELAAEFMAANPGTEVQVIAVDENDIPEKIAAAKAAGTLPDVMHLSIDYVVGYATEGLLDEAANTAVIQELGEDGFFAGTLEFAKSPTGAAKYAAVPIDSWVQGIWYRKDLFEEAGLNPPQTWDDIMAAAKHFNKPAEGFYGIVLGTFPNEVFTQQVFEEFALANGARPFDVDGNVVLGSDRFAEAMDYYAELSQYGPPGKTTWRDCRQYFIAGQCAMMFYSTYIMDDLAGLVEDVQVEVEDLTGKTGMESLMIGAHGDEASYGQVNYVAVTKGANTEVAKAWIEFLLSDENYIKWVFMTPAGKTPVRKSTVEEWSQAELFGYYDPAIAETIAGGLDAVKRWGYQEGKSFPLLSDIYGSLIVPQAVVSVIEGSMTSTEAAAWAQSQLEDLAGQ